MSATSSNRKSLSLPDELLIMIFEQVLLGRKPGSMVPLSSKRRKTAGPVFVLLSLVSRHFRDLALPFLHRQFTATEMSDPRLTQRLQEICSAQYGSSGNIRSGIKAVHVCWDLEEANEANGSRVQRQAIELAKLRSRLYQCFANLHYCDNLDYLNVTLRASDDDRNDSVNLLPDISDFACLPFLQSLRSLVYSNGCPQNQDDAIFTDGLSASDFRTMTDFLKMLRNLDHLSLSGYDLDDFRFHEDEEEAGRLDALWPTFSHLDITEMDFCATSFWNNSPTSFYRAISRTVKSICVTTQFASAKISPVIAQHPFPHLHTLSLRDFDAQNVAGTAANCDWSRFFEHIPACTNLEIDFTRWIQQTTWSTFLSALSSSRTTIRTMRCVRLRLMGPYDQIDSIQALEAIDVLFPLAINTKLRYLNIHLEEMERFSEQDSIRQFMVDNPALSTISHAMLYKCLNLLKMAESNDTDITIHLSEENSYYSRLVFDEVHLDARRHIVTISMHPRKLTEVDLLLTFPLQAVIVDLKEQGFGVHWNL